jgi:hypothetical protein
VDDAGVEGRALAIEGVAHPAHVLGRRVLEAEPAQAEHSKAQLEQAAAPRLEARQVHDREVVAELLVAGDALVVGEEVAAAVEDRPLAVDLMALAWCEEWP